MSDEILENKTYNKISIKRSDGSQKVLLDISDDTVTEESLLIENTAHDKTGNLVHGLIEQGGVSGTQVYDDDGVKVKNWYANTKSKVVSGGNWVQEFDADTKSDKKESINILKVNQHFGEDDDFKVFAFSDIVFPMDRVALAAYIQSLPEGSKVKDYLTALENVRPLIDWDGTSSDLISRLQESSYNLVIDTSGSIGVVAGFINSETESIDNPNSIACVRIAKPNFMEKFGDVNIANNQTDITLKYTTLFKFANGTNGLKITGSGRVAAGRSTNSSDLDDTLTTKDYVDGSVVANPTDVPDAKLTRLKLKGTTYNLAGGGASVYSNYEAFVDEWNDKAEEDVEVGWNIYIRTIEVPDLWVSANNETPYSKYNYTTDANFIEDLKREAESGLQIGYYKVNMLEGEKVYIPEFGIEVTRIG